MRMTCRFILKAVEDRYPQGANRLSVRWRFATSGKHRSRIPNVSSKRNHPESRRRVTPRRYATRGWKLHTASCILRAAFVRFNTFDIRSFIRTRDRRYYLCKRTKAGYIGLRLPATGAGFCTREHVVQRSSLAFLPDASFNVFPTTLDYGWIADVSGNHVDVDNGRRQTSSSDE